MIEPKNITLDGMKFHLQPLPSLRAIRLDKKIMTLLVPILGGFKELSLEAEVDFETIARGLSQALERMTDDEFEKTIVELLVSVQYMKNGAAPQELTKESIDHIFMGKIGLMYKLIFEVMRFNKFSPFALVEGGNVIQKILSSTNQIKSEKKTGNKSEKSVGLLDS